MRRRKAQAHENHERWLVSYADFITLLFAFFVVMFATAQADKAKAKVVSDSVREALEHGKFSAAVSAVLGRSKPRPAPAPPARNSAANAAKPVETPQPSPLARELPADLVASLETLQRGLDPELKNGKIALRLEPRGLVISLREAGFFNSGDDVIAPGSITTLAKIAGVIQGVPNPLRLEGFTDSIPIHNSRFRNNWELSSARAIAMLELLRERFQVSPSRMSVAGYAENAPVEPNTTAEGRARNRRVDVVLLSAEAARVEPQPGSTAAPPPPAPSRK